MDFFDIIKELRKGKADIQKASKAMKILGWVCIIGGIWNALFDFIFPFGDNPFNLPPSYPYLALAAGIFLGFLFFLSSKAILKKEHRGKRIGQTAVLLLIVMMFSFTFLMFPIEKFPMDGQVEKIGITIFFAIFFAQFGIPAYLGVRYLGRLPVIDNETIERFEPENSIKEIQGNTEENHKEKYKDSVFPFGILGTFVLIMALGMIPVFTFERFTNSNNFGFFFFPGFVLIFFTPIVYNYFPSPFQKRRETIAAFTGGGSIFLFTGTWPFFRLFIYEDGIEIRVMLHRFFIPYDEMGEFPDKLGFFNRGILIESNLPDVPSGIRYNGFGMSKILKILQQNKTKFEDDHI